MSRIVGRCCTPKQRFESLSSPLIIIRRYILSTFVAQLKHYASKTLFIEHEDEEYVESLLYLAPGL